MGEDNSFEMAKNVEEMLKKLFADKLREALEEWERGQYLTIRDDDFNILMKVKKYDVKMMQRSLELYFSYLNEKSEIRDGARFYGYIDELKSLERELMGLGPHDCKVLEYFSGKKCLYDAIADTLQKHDVYQYGAAYVASSDKSLGKNLKRLAELPYTFLQILKTRASMNYMSSLILGQYDILSIRPAVFKGTVRIVTPNIHAIARKWNTGVVDTEKYVAFHEYIHDGQATNFPIEERLNEVMRKFLISEILISSPELREKMRVSVDTKKIRSDSLNEANALVCVLEGHAEYFGGKVSQDLIPDFKFERKYSILSALKNKFYGFEEKIEQYVQGSRFIGYLHEKGGADLANLPLKVYPSMAEIRDPELYLRRAKLEGMG